METMEKTETMKNTSAVKRFAAAIGCAIVAILPYSCEITLPDPPSPESAVRTDTFDFETRYPGARILEAYRLGGDETITDIKFIDRDGLEGKAIYCGGTWMVTEKKYDTGNFLYMIPRKVARAYIGTGVEYEDYCSDNYYVVEISRNGIDRKQYEFLFDAPYSDGTEYLENLVHHIVIDEDGTLLTCSHHSFNRSIWWHDMRTSIGCVRARYPEATLLGAVNDCGNNTLFIRDGGILKKVVTHDRGFGFEWQETTYSLDMDTPLPASVVAEKESYEKAHPGQKFFALSSVERPHGLFYGLTFGEELNNTTIYSKAE